MHRIDINDSSLRESDIRKGEFREVARDIVSNDRASKKMGRSVDTGGAIARAMESAYKLGLRHGSNSENKAEVNQRQSQQRNPAISWNTIPPRSRSALEGILRCKWLVVLKRDIEPWKKNSDKWACYWDWGEERPEDQRYQLAQTFSPSTLAPIIRLGLVRERAVGETMILEPTETAFAAWEAAILAGHAYDPN